MLKHLATSRTGVCRFAVMYLSQVLTYLMTSSEAEVVTHVALVFISDKFFSVCLFVLVLFQVSFQLIVRLHKETTFVAAVTNNTFVTLLEMVFD